MQKINIGKFANENLTFYQCETLEETKKENLPNGVYSYWVYKGQKIFTPGEIVSMVIQHSQDGTFDINQMVSQQGIQDYYKTLCDAQRKSAIESLQKTREMLVQQSIHSNPEIINAQLKNLDNTIKMYKNNMPMPGINGLFKPTKSQAGAMLNGKENMDKVIDPNLQKEIFTK